MADLVTTITETVTLNGSLRGSSNVVTTSDVIDVSERITTCVFGKETVIATFDTAPWSTPGAIDKTNTVYVRVTNLDELQDVQLKITTATTSAMVTISAGQSFILSKAVNVIKGGNPVLAFGTLEDIVNLTIKPTSATLSARVALFVALQ
tara:strand:+ start:8648 stop:9097 length:450 start_codon:yes stop_codon:yes gene_type:complete